MTSTKRRSLSVGSRETGPTHPPATFDSVPEEATETQAHPQLQTGTFSLSNTVLATSLQSTSRHKAADFQAGHAFHQPSTPLHPQAYTSLPATSSEKIPSAAPLSLAITRPDIQPPHTTGELTGELSSQSASYSGIQRPSALSLGSSSAHRTQPPADQSIEGHKPHAPASSKPGML